MPHSVPNTPQARISQLEAHLREMTASRNLWKGRCIKFMKQRNYLLRRYKYGESELPPTDFPQIRWSA